MEGSHSVVYLSHARRDTSHLPQPSDMIISSNSPSIPAGEISTNNQGGETNTTSVLSHRPTNATTTACKGQTSTMRTAPSASQAKSGIQTSTPPISDDIVLETALDQVEREKEALRQRQLNQPQQYTLRPASNLTTKSSPQNKQVHSNISSRLAEPRHRGSSSVNSKTGSSIP
eukprot:6852781-Ditylum_brightwellii.AAC.1